MAIVDAPSTDEKVKELLQQVGLHDEVVMDPASLEALREYLSGDDSPLASPSLLGKSIQRDNEDNKPVEVSKKMFSPLSSMSPLSISGETPLSVSTRTTALSPNQRSDSPHSPRIQKLIADLTNTLETTTSPTSDQATTGSVASQQNNNDRLLKLVEYQSQLILALFDRVEDLHEKVDRMTTEGGLAITEDAAPVTVARSPVLQRLSRPAPAPVTGFPFGLRRRRAAPPSGTPAVEEPVTNVRQQQRRPPRPPNLIVLPFVVSVFNAVFGPVIRGRLVLLNRCNKLTKLFFDLRRRQVPNFDVGLLFKVLVMMIILMARMSSLPSKTPHDSDNTSADSPSIRKILWAHRFHLLTSVIVAGFLVQSGYAEFLYQFFIKHNYPVRILWNGQDIDLDEAILEEARDQEARAAAARLRAPAEPQVPPVQRPLAAARAGDAQPQQNQQRGWRQAVLAGEIPRAAPEQPQNRPLVVLMETAVLVGSFFLSVLPMWTPHAPPLAPQPQLNDEDEGDAMDDDGDDNGLPEVRPPADPTEYADDNED